MRGTKTELTTCHDCGGAVSFSAAACPHCGSNEPGGPYVFNKKEAQRLRIEQRNDDSMAWATLICTAVGALYGYSLAADGGAGWMTLSIVFYGALGLLAGVPIGFLFNLARAFMR